MFRMSQPCQQHGFVLRELLLYAWQSEALDPTLAMNSVNDSAYFDLIDLRKPL